MTKLIKTLVYTAVDFESNLLLHIYILLLNLFSFFYQKKKPFKDYLSRDHRC